MAFFTSDEGMGPWVVRLGTQLHEALIHERGLFLLRASLNAALLFYTALLVSIDLVKQHRVSVDTIIGGINLYLLFAIGFMFLHGIVEVSNPSPYQFQGEPLTEIIGESPGVMAAGVLLYFSVVTMTTLGYGDIGPVAPVARMLCGGEAVVGQLYVAVFIARLVALQVGQRSTRNG